MINVGQTHACQRFCTFCQIGTQGKWLSFFARQHLISPAKVFFQTARRRVIHSAPEESGQSRSLWMMSWMFSEGFWPLRPRCRSEKLDHLNFDVARPAISMSTPSVAAVDDGQGRVSLTHRRAALGLHFFEPGQHAVHDFRRLAIRLPNAAFPRPPAGRAN